MHQSSQETSIVPAYVGKDQENNETIKEKFNVETHSDVGIQTKQGNRSLELQWLKHIHPMMKWKSGREMNRIRSTELLIIRSQQMHVRKMMFITTIGFLFVIVAISTLELDALMTLTVLLMFVFCVVSIVLFS